MVSEFFCKFPCTPQSVFQGTRGSCIPDLVRVNVLSAPIQRAKRHHFLPDNNVNKVDIFAEAQTLLSDVAIRRSCVTARWGELVRFSFLRRYCERQKDGGCSSGLLACRARSAFSTAVAAAASTSLLCSCVLVTRLVVSCCCGCASPGSGWLVRVDVREQAVFPWRQPPLILKKRQGGG